MINFHILGSNKNMQKVIECTFIFLMIWIFVGYYIIYNAQSQIKSWAEQEHKVIGFLS